MIKHSLRIGFIFGLTSGTITTLGLMVGLHSGTRSRLAVIGGILTIAIADAFSDAIGIHVSEESENEHTEKQIWASTLATLFFKFVSALVFVIPVLLFELSTAIVISVLYGLFLVCFLSFRIARQQGVRPGRVVAEHAVVVLVVVVITHYAGDLIAATFG